MGKEASFTYDTNGNLLQETGPCGDKFSYTYTKLGEVENVTDEAGRETCYVSVNGKFSIGGKNFNGSIGVSGKMLRA